MRAKISSLPFKVVRATVKAGSLQAEGMTQGLIPAAEEKKKRILANINLKKGSE